MVIPLEHSDCLKPRFNMKKRVKNESASSGASDHHYLNPPIVKGDGYFQVFTCTFHLLTVPQFPD